jgi:Fe-S-cluster-containing hydrogenase component 2
MKMIRSIIKIDKEKCIGCEQCIPNYPEGAIQIIGSKANMQSSGLPTFQVPVNSILLLN